MADMARGRARVPAPVKEEPKKLETIQIPNIPIN